MRSLLAAGGFLDPEELLRKGGLALLGLIVFAESGLLVGFFLPGDSLLFIAGFLASDAGGNVLPPLPLVLLVAFVTAVVGDQVGYIFGKKVGPALFDKPDSRIFKQKYVEKAHGFFERHGAKTIVLARFVPIVRTFITVMAGVGTMSFRRFMIYSALGGVLWAVGVTLLGYYLGSIPFVKNNVEVMILAFVAIAIVPVAVEYLRERAARKLEAITEE
jgi:membrane-associated protein